MIPPLGAGLLSEKTVKAARADFLCFFSFL